MSKALIEEEEEEQEGGMSFWDHLEDLRWTIIRSIAVIFIFTVAIFLFKEIIFDDLILAPRTSNFIFYRWLCQFGELIRMPGFCPESFNIEVQNINLASQFFIHMSTSFWLGLIFAFPYVLYELWKFLTPALYSHERRPVTRAFFFGAILFFAGIAVGYLIIFPLTLRFLGTYQVSADVMNIISLNSYINNFLSLIFIMGIVFEMPMLAFLLSKFGIVSKTFLKRYRKHAIVIILIMAAVITPSADAFTMFMVAIPLYLLYELSILVCVKPKREDDDD